VQHNYCIEHRLAEVRDTNYDDEQGVRDSQLPPTHEQGVQRVDHRGRRRPLDPRVVLVASENPMLADLEEDEDEAHLARFPAWHQDADVSPRDPLYALTSKPGAHQAGICGPRAAVTARMEHVGQMRPPEYPMHW